MSFKVLQENLLKSKVFDLNYMQKHLEIKNNFDLVRDEEVPKQLRESLKSRTANLELNEFQEELLAVVRSREKGNSGDQCNDNRAQGCTSDCSFGSCLAQEPSRDSEIFIASNFCTSISLANSDVSIKELPTRPILSITRLVPLRNNSVIIHWHAKTTHGIRGYQIFLDGNLASTVYSSERTIALIKNVNMSVSHDFTIFIVPHETFFDNFLKNEQPLMKPVTYFYKPRRL